jgi:hypothetical protein
MSERSLEANKLDADLSAGRLMAQALHQAQQAYCFSPSTYTYECLSAMHRLHRQLEQILRSTAGEDADRSSFASPQQDTQDTLL